MPHARRAAELAPESGDVADTLGYALLQSGKASEAVAVLRAAVQKPPQRGLTHVRLAQALLRDGKSDEARAVLRKVMSDEKLADGRKKGVNTNPVARKRIFAT